MPGTHPATRTLRNRFALLVAVFASNMAIGALGFYFIANYPWVEAIYMALITMLTIGYGEILPLSQTARIFNIGFMIVAVTSQLGTLAALTQAIVEWEVAGGFGRRRRIKMIRELKDHYIVCGYGRVGRGAADELQRAHQSLVVVDRNPERVRRAESLGILAFEGDSTKDETLRAVGIERAKGVIATMGSDADNLFLVISARALNPGIPVVARAVEEEAIEKLRRAGAKDVKAPFRATGQNLANSLIKPHVVEFLDFALLDPSLNLGIEQIDVRPGSSLAGRSLGDLRLRNQLKVIVLAIRRANGAMEFNPEGKTVIDPGDSLVVMGEVADLRKLESITTIGTHA
jgi:voltage-gated potassium channel